MSAGTLLGSIERLEQEGLDFLRLASQLAIAAIPSNLVARALALTDALDAETAEEQAMLGFRPNAKCSHSQSALLPGAHQPTESTRWLPVRCACTISQPHASWRCSGRWFGRC